MSSRSLVPPAERRLLGSDGARGAKPPLLRPEKQERNWKDLVAGWWVRFPALRQSRVCLSVSVCGLITSRSVNLFPDTTENAPVMLSLERLPDSLEGKMRLYQILPRPVKNSLSGWVSG